MSTSKPLTDLVAILEVSAYALYSATLVGNPAPWVQRLHEDITRPKVGDLVLEISSRFLDRTNGDRLGYLIADAGDYGIKTIRTLDGREIRWDNAQFIKVIASHEELQAIHSARP